MAGKSIKKLVRDLKKRVADEGSYRDPSMTWVAEVSGNVIHGRLLGLHVPDDQTPYYRVQLKEGCKVMSRGRRKATVNASVGMIVSVVETADVSCLRFFVHQMAKDGSMFDVWVKWMPIRQEVNVMRIEEGGVRGKKEDLDERVP